MQQIFVSLSAAPTKSLRGATKLVAKKGFKIADDDHDANVSKGDVFYVKKLGDKHYFIDLDGKDKYQFSIPEKKYNQLMKEHKPDLAEWEIKFNATQDRKAAMGGYIEAHFDTITKHPDYAKALKIEEKRNKAMTDKVKLFLKLEDAPFDDDKSNAQLKKLGTDPEIVAYRKILKERPSIAEFLMKHNPDYKEAMTRFSRATKPLPFIKTMRRLEDYYVKNAKYAQA